MITEWKIRFALLLVLPLMGCSYRALLDERLISILPPDAEARISETCVSSMFAPAALLSDVSFPLENGTQVSMDNGRWIRSPSLSEFSEADAKDHQGLGVSGTILDSKECLRKMTDDAEAILFGIKKGWYFRSNDREIVAIIFDEPKGAGVMMIQAP